MRISVGVHHQGRVIDVNNALDGEGPFSPERSGTLPAGQLVDLCFSGKYNRDQIKDMIMQEGGLFAYLHTNDARKIELAARNGDKKAAFYMEAMAYQISKTIGEMATVLKGKIDGILLTGQMAYDWNLMKQIRERVDFIAPVFVYPGQDELKSLAMNALMVAREEIEPRVYDKVNQIAMQKVNSNRQSLKKAMINLFTNGSTSIPPNRILLTIVYCLFFIASSIIFSTFTTDLN